METTTENLNHNTKMNPQKIYLFSGKRKCGKDFITDRLYERLNNEDAVIIKISAPIKSHWSTMKGLDYQLLLGSGSYKEKCRKEMILWSEQERKNDYGIFCRTAIQLFNAMEKPVWIVSDIRRKTDILWFKENFGTVITTVRIICDEEVRIKRGWSFEEGIDDEESECDLDDVTEWDLIITNNERDGLDVIIDSMKSDLENSLTKL